MKTNKPILPFFSLILLFFACFTDLQAEETAPRWVVKGVNELNDCRSNLTYEFVSLEMHDSDTQRLTANNAVVLGEYVQRTLGGRQESVKVSEEPVDTTLYHVAYATADGTPHWVIARLVDKAFLFDDYEESVYEYQLHQLFAISKPDTYPDYDEFIITRKYKSKAVEMSLIPGLGQIYKGQPVKGIAIMAGEGALVLGTIYFETQRAKCHRESLKGGSGIDSWEKKSKSWKAMRDLGIGCAVALYIYNLIDAAYSKGIPQVVVKKKTDSRMQVAPFVDNDLTGLSTGLSIALNF